MRTGVNFANRNIRYTVTDLHRGDGRHDAYA